MPRYLTKSRFKLACGCPTKLFYQDFKEIYPNANDGNDFLEALAEGGYQVGKLAEFKYPGGLNIDTLKTEEAIALTTKELKKENCIIYEAAFVYENLLVRTDVLVKKGNQIKVYEVKAKSYSKSEDDDFLNKNGIVPAWQPYIYDIAFQKYVVSKALPKCKVSAYLTLIDKDRICSLDGMQQLFKMKRPITNDTKDGKEVFRRRKYVDVKVGTKTKDIDTDILTSVNIDSIIDRIHKGEFKIDYNNKELNKLNFAEQISKLAESYNKQEKITADVTSGCKQCEFQISSYKLKAGEKSGRWECLQSAWKLKEEDRKESLLFDLAGGTRKDLFNTLIEQKKYFLKNITREDLLTKDEQKKFEKGKLFFSEESFSNTDRRATQAECEANPKDEFVLKDMGLSKVINELKYPLHFIDFETIASAIPYNKGLRPYEVIAFQYSHHILEEDGTIKHSGEWINLEKGKFPSFDFLRNLKAELSDGKPIFRYSHHENTVLRKISDQLKNSVEIDKVELMGFVSHITTVKIDKKTKIIGSNSMIDLCEWIKDYYYNPLTKGSNSIKKVLPAVMSTSVLIKEKYSKPYFSRNFPAGQIWFKEENGKAIDPYKLLPPVNSKLAGIDLDDIDAEESYDDGKKLNSGGPAMAAYAEMQFEDISEKEFNNLKNALLRYCELDTLAMVMIFEHLKELVEEK